MFLIFSMKRPDVLPVGDLGAFIPALLTLIPDPLTLGTNKPFRRRRHPKGTVQVVQLRRYWDPFAQALPSCSLRRTSLDSQGEVYHRRRLLSHSFDSVSCPRSRRGRSRARSLAVRLPHHLQRPLSLVDEVASEREEAQVRFSLLAAKDPADEKRRGNIYLTPTEMEELTSEWAPYRSVACWYLWSITDGTGDA